jgi:hypothetical protein
MQDSWLSITGSVVSIGAAIWAFVEAKRSAQAASKAEAVRNELVQRRTIVEISQVHAESIRILRLVSQVGPSCTKASTRGINVQSIAQGVEEYSRFLNEHSGHFNASFQNSARTLCDELTVCIEELAEAVIFDAVKVAGKKIYYLINSFLPEVKRLADDKRESPPFRSKP